MYSTSREQTRKTRPAEEVEEDAEEEEEEEVEEEEENESGERALRPSGRRRRLGRGSRWFCHSQDTIAEHGPTAGGR